MGTGEISWTEQICALRSRIDKCDLIKLQSFGKAKDTVNRTKWQPTDWKKIFTNPKSDRGLISNIFKELKKLDSRESFKISSNYVVCVCDSLNYVFVLGWFGLADVRVFFLYTWWNLGFQLISPASYCTACHWLYQARNWQFPPTWSVLILWALAGSINRVFCYHPSW